jgi:hypothetical protein
MIARRFFLLSALAACSFAVNSCTGLGSAKAPQSGQVEHVVMVWLKHPGDAHERAKLVEASRQLKDIPGVISVSGGTPIPSKRPIVDATFDVGFVIRFENAAAMTAYLTHPIHVKLTNEVLTPASRKVVVHDFTVE